MDHDIGRVPRMGALHLQESAPADVDRAAARRRPGQHVAASAGRGRGAVVEENETQIVRQRLSGRAEVLVQPCAGPVGIVGQDLRATAVGELLARLLERGADLAGEFSVDEEGADQRGRGGAQRGLDASEGGAGCGEDRQDGASDKPNPNPNPKRPRQRHPQGALRAEERALPGIRRAPSPLWKTVARGPRAGLDDPIRISWLFRRCQKCACASVSALSTRSGTS